MEDIPSSSKINSGGALCRTGRSRGLGAGAWCGSCRTRRGAPGT